MENEEQTQAKAARGTHDVVIPVIKDLHEFTPDPQALIKALIFSSPEYLTARALKEIIEGIDVPQIRAHIKKINQKLIADNEPFEIVEVNNSYRYRTRSAYYPWVKKLFRETGARRLSPAALEILAIVAYKQPITKAEIEDIRGVNVDGTLKGLLEKKLITITGKSEKIGNAYNYGTSKEFLQYFNINRVPEDLPKLSEFESLINNSALIPQIGEAGEILEIEQHSEDDSEESDEL